MTIKQLTHDEVLALLDALSDDPSNREEDDLLRQNNPVLYAAILKLRKIAGPT